MASPIARRSHVALAASRTPDQATHDQRRRSAALALDANALELFARVAAAGSFAEAARRLGQTRAAVSRRIAAIEALAGQPLMARTTRSLGLTEAGRRLAQRARAVQEAADAARGALRASRAGLAGRLRVTAAPSFGRAVLAPLLARFRERHPGSDSNCSSPTAGSTCCATTSTSPFASRARRPRTGSLRRCCRS
jgi:molybdenum-dependent DNA-binding transcriptional regulator ModE